MQSKYVAILFCLFLTGCYTTAPQHWSLHSTRDIVEQSEEIRNGSRLNISAQLGNNDIRAHVSEVAQCRKSEIGHTRLEEHGVRESHGWPGGLFGVAMLGGGVALDGDGLSGSMNKTKLAEMLGGGAALAIGAIIFGKCVLSDCGPDPDIESRESDGTNFRRWKTDASRYDCSGAVQKLPGSIQMRLESTFPDQKKVLAWERETDATGNVEYHVLDTIQSVAAHCGKSRVFVYSKGEQKPPSDSPALPSSVRDETAVYELGVNPGTPESPDRIKDPVAKDMAWMCAKQKTETCVGVRIKTITDQCTKSCDSDSGAGYCKVQLESELAIPGLSEDERSDSQTRYDKCVTEHGVTSSNTSECKSNCIDQASKEICPRPW